MSFQLFTGPIIEKEVLEMITALQKNPSSYALSDLPKQIIKESAKVLGFKVSTKSVNYRQVKVTLVDTLVTDLAKSDSEPVWA